MKQTRASSACFSLSGLCLITLLGLSCAPCVNAQASSPTAKPLFVFTCNSTTNVCPQGKDPDSLIQSSDGNFYGTTEFGGSKQDVGTVFKLTPAGQLTTLYTFTSSQTGANPTSLAEGNDGFLYGTTASGGAAAQGTIFKLSKTGTIQTLYSFCAATCNTGSGPFNLLLGSDGNFYGCTIHSNPGTLFRITPGGVITLLHTFDLGVDGPQCIGLILGSDGNIYGDTVGAMSIPTVLFRFTPSGEMTVLHTWKYSQFPVSPPAQASDGSLWGVLSHIVSQPGTGIFSAAASGAGYREIPVAFGFNTLKFITQASDGNFWGTFSGNAVVSFSLGGKPLQQIPLPTTTSGPAVLLQASDGRLIVATNNAGFDTGDAGEIFAVEPALAPPKPLFVTFQPSSGKAGSQVNIRGFHFVGTTAVKFSGALAKFHVLNGGNIQATVPVGATTGPIAIVNLGGETVTTQKYTVQ